MIKLKFDEKTDAVEMYREKKIIASLNPEDFGSLIREIKRIMEEASPSIARKQERKRERKNLINQLKILLAIKAIDFWRWLKSLFVVIKL